MDTFFDIDVMDDNLKPGDISYCEIDDISFEKYTEILEKIVTYGSKIHIFEICQFMVYHFDNVILPSTAKLSVATRYGLFDVCFNHRVSIIKDIVREHRELKI